MVRSIFLRNQLDQTPAAAIDRVCRHVPERADELLKKRFRIIKYKLSYYFRSWFEFKVLTLNSVWRPIGDPVENFPLAFMDGSAVPEDKLIEVDVVRRSFPGESYYPLENGGYKWYFMDRQTQDDVLFMKMNDSDSSVKAKCKSEAKVSRGISGFSLIIIRLPTCLFLSVHRPRRQTKTEHRGEGFGIHGYVGAYACRL